MNLHKLLIFLPLLYLNISFGQGATLYVTDPQNPWWWEQATIEEADFVIKPQGLYTQVDMYLTFSARNTSFESQTQLEVVAEMNFPEGVMFIDSWLWIEDVIVKAEIIDRWTASGIYEEIVGRQQDPSILFKNSERDYMLRIYPMLANASRRVKLSYLTPASWTNERVSSVLPLFIQQTSYNPLDKITLRYLEEGEYSDLSIAELPAQTFNQGIDPELGKFQETIIRDPYLLSQLTLEAPAPFKDGVYVRNYEGKNSNYYQLAILPTQVFGLPQTSKRKVLALLDFNESNNSFISQTGLLQALKMNLKTHLLPSDSFNLMYSNLNFEIDKASDAWVAASAKNIDSLFSVIGQRPIVNYNNVPPLLLRGLDYLKDNGNSGRILLVSDSDKEGGQETANQLLNEVQSRMGDTTFQINILDLTPRRNRSFYTINGIRYEGNQYFYQNLTRLSRGNQLRQVNSNASVENNLDELMAQISSFMGTLDLYTTLQNGFCYNRYQLTGNQEFTNLNKPVLQIGKYEGAFPFVIEAAGEYNDILFGESLTIPASDIVPADSTAEDVWVGTFINQLEQEAYDNNTISEIINRSISARVLSLYTAFIALEPGLGGEPCLDCNDDTEGGVVDVEEIEVDSAAFDIEIYPNPFRERATINIVFKERIDLEDFEFIIFNALGQQVKRFNTVDGFFGNEIQLEWDATDESGQEIEPGIYLFSVQNASTRTNKKLIHIK